MFHSWQIDKSEGVLFKKKIFDKNEGAFFQIKTELAPSHYCKGQIVCHVLLILQLHKELFRIILKLLTKIDNTSSTQNASSKYVSGVQ